VGVYCGGLAPPEFAILCKMDVRPDDLACPARGWPIVVDLDGTLTPVDTLAESLVARVRNAPGTLFLPRSGSSADARDSSRQSPTAPASWLCAFHIEMRCWTTCAKLAPMGDASCWPPPHIAR
jgi:hypothetical protein